MAKKQRGSARQHLMLWLVGVPVAILVFLTLIWTIYILQGWQVESVIQKSQILVSLGKEPIPPEIESELATAVYSLGLKAIVVFITIFSVLFATIILLLLILGYQMYLRGQDLKKLDSWRESGFFCERLEFLPANRVKLNNIELELNKTQIENLQKLAHHRIKGKPLHSLDMGDHAVQSIKRLREELGAKFIEKSFVKVRRSEGYWLEVDAGKIHGLLETK